MQFKKYCRVIIIVIIINFLLKFYFFNRKYKNSVDYNYSIGNKKDFFYEKIIDIRSNLEREIIYIFESRLFFKFYFY